MARHNAYQISLDPRLPDRQKHCVEQNMREVNKYIMTNFQEMGSGGVVIRSEKYFKIILWYAIQ